MWSSARARTAAVIGAAIVLVVIGACSDGTGLKPAVCDTNPLSLNPGEVQAPLSGTCAYIAGGASAGEYALVPFNADTLYSSVATLTFTTRGVTPVTAPLQTRTAATAQASLSVATGANAPGPNALFLERNDRFDAMLRASERRVLSPLIPAARAWFRQAAIARTANPGSAIRLTPSTRPSLASATTPWVVGDTIALNAKSGPTLADACQIPDLRAGRVVAITNTAIVVADTGNPAGGYSDAEYLAIGTQFDSVYAMDTGAFGTPSDIDGNGKIILFFTRAVNELSPPNSQSVVGGFFYARDLFPKQDSPALGAGSGCPTSNVAEMFYLMVPDSAGVVNGNVRPKSYVSHLSVSTTAHEFQHLINAARRLYVNMATADFEVVWLNEGLSHIAEELLFYQQSLGLTPRLDLDSTKFRGTANQPNVNAYNYDQASNFGRFRTYLTRPSTSSPYAPDDSLWTRGATWSFLRYAADHRGTGDGDTWYRLVNSTTTGLGTLRSVFGTDLTSLFRDWAISHVTDDVPGVASEWQHPSWNFRSMYGYIPSVKGYPLATTTVGDNAPLTVSVNGGSVAYVRFTVAAGATSSVHWSTTSSGVAMSLVRLK